MNLSRTRVLAQRARGGFTLIELLVVIAIIALLIGILLPALAKARDSGRNIVCQSNLRGLAQAVLMYSQDYNGRFAPNQIADPDDPTKYAYWYDMPRLGSYLPQFNANDTPSQGFETIIGGIMACPNHPAAGRSYTINMWSSSKGAPTSGTLGKTFTNAVDESSSMLLIGEAWAGCPVTDVLNTGNQVWATKATMGELALPGQRFGGGDGIPPGSASCPQGFGVFNRCPEADPTGTPTAYIPYYRHPKRLSETFKIEGGANLSFIDGHVAQKNPQQLFDQGTGVSTFDVLWSQIDRRVDVDPNDP